MALGLVVPMETTIGGDNMEQHIYIGLMAHTIGSIGQIVKDESTLTFQENSEGKLNEIKRIYNGFIKAVTVREQPKK